MKKTISIIALIFSFVSTFAQYGFVNHHVQASYHFQEEMSPSYLLADEVILRKEPNTKSTALDVFPIGTKMYLLDRSVDTFEVKGIQSHWYKVKIQDQLGWIWGGFIAQHAFGSTSDPSVKFVGGLSRKVWDEEDTRFIMFYQIRAFRDGKQLDKIELESFAWGIGGFYNHGNKGLASVSDVLSVHIPCTGGCGCLTGDIFVFWSHNQFHHVRDLTGTPDGSYSEGSHFIFPSDMEGKRGYIICVSSRVKDEATNENQQITREVRKVFYRWNGSKLVKGDIEPIVFTYLMED